ncbi:hypothetical protein TSUD_290130 [Trifolium subterraneum]|uniref:Uncharacterized protein n=1 Tax=Trifolium subterraneum TaxID=3900 RepID=A0A2Z6N6M0_TRISU|nr:hypothetical protein TSUD_290130 [Trifolium subterraneum]
MGGKNLGYDGSGDQDAVVPFMSIDASFQHTVGMTDFGCSLKCRDGTFVQVLTKNVGYSEVNVIATSTRSILE